jgi:hypothetical protein
MEVIEMNDSISPVATATSTLESSLVGLDSARGSVTHWALVTEAMYRSVLIRKDLSTDSDGIVIDCPRTGDNAPKAWYTASGLTEEGYKKAKGYLSDARLVITHALAFGLDGELEISAAEGSLDTARRVANTVVEAVAAEMNSEAISLTELAKVIRNAYRKPSAGRNGGSTETETETEGFTAEDIEQARAEAIEQARAEAKEHAEATTVERSAWALGKSVAEGALDMTVIVEHLFAASGMGLEDMRKCVTKAWKNLQD